MLARKERERVSLISSQCPAEAEKPGCKSGCAMWCEHSVTTQLWEAQSLGSRERPWNGWKAQE
jgi:hypothetical protein